MTNYLSLIRYCFTGLMFLASYDIKQHELSRLGSNRGDDAHFGEPIDLGILVTCTTCFYQDNVPCLFFLFLFVFSIEIVQFCKCQDSSRGSLVSEAVAQLSEHTHFP